jgi:transposase
MTTKNGQHTGRRPKILDENVQKKIIDAILGGNYLETAAQYAGVSKTAIFEWLAKGREAQAQLDAGETLTVFNGELYAQFTDSVREAQAVAEVRTVALIQKAALTNWQAGAWYLERSKPRTWGRLDRAEISGPEGGAVQVDLADQRAKAALLLTEIASRSTVDGD